MWTGENCTLFTNQTYRDLEIQACPVLSVIALLADTIYSTPQALHHEILNPKPETRNPKHGVQRMAELGGVDYLYLTHRDDVADHMRWKVTPRV
jgi:hypothetical protein